MPFQLLTPKALSYYEELKKKGENVYIDKIDCKDFELLTDAGMKKRFISMEEQEQKERLDREQDNELLYAQEDVPERNRSRRQKSLCRNRRQQGAGLRERIPL